MIHKAGFSPTQPGLPYDLGWLLNHDQAGDSALCEALLKFYRGGMERLAASLLDSPAEVMAAVEAAVCKAILTRKQYKSEISGLGWLYRLLVKECIARQPRRISQPGRLRFFPLHRLSWKPAHLVGSYEIRTRDALPVTQAFHSTVFTGTHFEEFARGLEMDSQMLLFLLYGLGMHEEEAAYILHAPAALIQAEARSLKERLESHRQICPMCSVHISRFTDLETLLRDELLPDRPLFQQGEEDLARWQAAILEQVTWQQEAGRRKARLMQAGQVGVFILLLLAVLWATSNTRSSPPLPAAPRHASAAPAPNAELVTPATATAAARSAAAATPLTAEAQDQAPTADEILALARGSLERWNSLWAEVQVSRALPAAGSSQPQGSLRKQVWISGQAGYRATLNRSPGPQNGYSGLPGTSGFSRVISGILGGEPSTTYTIQARRLHGQDFQTGQVFESYPSNLLIDPDLQKLFLPQEMFPGGGSYLVQGGDSVAGRPAWVLDWKYDESRAIRYWVDTQYGVILRKQEFEGGYPDMVFAEAQVISISFNPPISPAIFDSYQYAGDHFARDFSGEPQLSNMQAAESGQSASRDKKTDEQFSLNLPQGFDPAKSRLSLQEPDTSGQSMLTLRADGKYLGQLPLPGSALLACQRSPDGSQIAYSSITGSEAGDTALTLANVARFPQARSVLPDGHTAGDFSFSPDGRQLAFFGCEKGACGVFVLDTFTGQRIMLVPLLYADYLFWKPDGKYLALVGEIDSNTILLEKSGKNLMMNEINALNEKWFFYVIRPDSGEIVYRQVFHWSQLGAPPDSPTQSWDTPFKKRLNDAQGCSGLPAGG